MHRACHNDVVGHLADEEWCPWSTSWWIHKKRANTDTSRALVRGGHDASYPRAEKMGEIAYGLRSPKELDIYFLPCGYKIDETWYTSFDHGQDHRTQEIRIEEKGGVDVTSKGALISKGVIILMEYYIIFLRTQLTWQYRELPTKEVKIKRRYYKSISVCKGVMIWREAPHRGLRQSHTILPLATWHRSLVAIEVARAWAHKMLTHLSYSKSRRLLARSVH